MERNDNNNLGNPSNLQIAEELINKTQDDHEQAKRRKANWLVRDIFEWGETVLSAIVAVVIIFLFVARSTSVDGESMLPTLKNDDHLLMSGLFYTPKQNDIVVIFSPTLLCCYPEVSSCSDNCRDRGGMGKDIIKRVIAVEGDTIKVSGHNGDGRVYVNGEELPLTIDGDAIFENNDHFINSLTYCTGGGIEVTIPEGYVFVMGDNRSRSIDSRFLTPQSRQGYVGLIDVNYIAGKAFFRISPFDSFGAL